MAENWLGYAEPPNDDGPEQDRPGCTCAPPDAPTTDHAPWCGKVGHDEVWTTARAASVLGVTRGNVARTLARQQPPVLPLAVDAEAVRGGAARRYLAREVWTAQRRREGSSQWMRRRRDGVTPSGSPLTPLDS